MAEAAHDGLAMPRSPAVVIVPTLGITADLKRCLAALQQQDCKDFGVLVVDSRPDAEAAALVERHGAHYLENSSTSRAAACNHALRSLDCEIILFTDDDCAPPPNWVGNLVRHFARPEVAGIGGPHIAPRDQSFWGKVVDVAFASPVLGLGLRYAKTYSGVCEVPHNPGCNAAYRKSVLDQVGGFSDAPFGAEDVALDYKITSRGNRLWFDPEAVTYHRRRDRFSTLARQMWAYGRGRADTNARFPDVARLLHALPSLVLVATVALLAACVAAGARELVLGSSASRALALALGLPLAGFAAAYAAGIAGAAFSSSPYRSFATVLCAPPVMMLSVIQYGRGFIHWHRVLKPRLMQEKA